MRHDVPVQLKSDVCAAKVGGAGREAVLSQLVAKVEVCVLRALDYPVPDDDGVAWVLCCAVRDRYVSEHLFDVPVPKGRQVSVQVKRQLGHIHRLWVRSADSRERSQHLHVSHRHWRHRLVSLKEVSAGRKEGRKEGEEVIEMRYS